MSKRWLALSCVALLMACSRPEPPAPAQPFQPKTLLDKAGLSSGQHDGGAALHASTSSQ